jgi:hypothetical protein
MIDEDEFEKTLALPGSDYVLTAARTDGGFHAAWTCEQCDESGYCNMHESAEAAIQAADHGARQHHQQFHSERPE